MSADVTSPSVDAAAPSSAPSVLNSHIRFCGPFVLMGGNPGAYLDGLRDAKNKFSDYPPDRTPFRKEKVAFDNFVAGAGGSTPRRLAFIGNGRVLESASRCGQDVETFLNTIPGGHYFCKPNGGRNGIGAFRLTVSPDVMLIDDEERSLAAIAETLSSEDYVIQEWLTPLQHPDIARFNADVINTMRLITFDMESGTRAVAASLRMAISLRTIDSWTQGGVVAAIDLDEGLLKPLGVLKKGLKLVDAHPGSGVAFRGQPVPHLRQAVTMACALHAKLSEARSLGWDIALLADGPCILEANRPWDILMSAQLNPELLGTFLAFHLPEHCDLVIRLDARGSFASRNEVCRALCRIMGVSLVSGRIEHLSHERLGLTIGGTRKAVQTAVQILKRRARELGVSHMAISPSQDEPRPGFDIAAVYAQP